MNKNIQTKKSISRQSELMQRILEIRYTDIEGEKRLCKLLLELSENEQYQYGSAFANVYLVDSHLALGEYGSCDFYLMRAGLLCSEHGYDDLMLVLCNSAGLYYQKLNDDQTALTYFLEGIKLAEKLGDLAMKSKLYNNVGYSFGRNEDLETAKTYFDLAYRTIESDLQGENLRNAVCYLTNLADTCKYLGDAEGCRQGLELCEKFSDDDIYSSIRLQCGWCAYHIAAHNWEESVKIVDQLLESHLLKIEEQFFICDMAEGLCNNMLAIGDHERTKRLLDVVLNISYDTSIMLRYRVQCLKIRCWEAFGLTGQLQQAYKDYYEIAMKITAVEDDAHTQSMISKIHIRQAVSEREAMQKQVQALEDASQVDELTGLYNRRYFNKMVSKVIHQDGVNSLGFIMLDVDYFKQYNDFYGHFEGDNALCAVSQVLSGNAIDGIHASRYGGDEFVCLCVNLKDEEVDDYVRKVIEELRGKQIFHEKSLVSDFLSISIGYCNEPFDTETDTDVLLDLADQALYLVKETGRGKSIRKRLQESGGNKT